MPAPHTSSNTVLSRRRLLGGLGAAGAGALAAGLGLAPPARATSGATRRHTTARGASRTTTPFRRAVQLRGRPSAQSEMERLMQGLRTTDFTSTGAYLPAGGTVEVDVRSTGGQLPALHVGAPATHPDEQYASTRDYALTEGHNQVADAGGGMLYLSLHGDESRALVQFRQGAVRAPYFVLDATTEDDFQEQLDTWTDAPQVELVSEGIILTVTREGMLGFRDEDHAELLRQFERILDSHAAISGLDGSDPVHARTPLPFHLVESPRMPPGAGAYATHGWTAYPRGYLDRLITMEGLFNRGWGVWHELGHQHQQIPYRPVDLLEVTVNIYSLAMQRTSGLESNLVIPDLASGQSHYDTAFTKLDQDTAFLDYGVMERLVMLWQLDLAFGEDFWPRLHRMIREERPQSEWTETTKRYNYLGYYSSKTAGYDLTGFFDRWRLPYDDDGRQLIAGLNLPEPPVDPSTLRE